MEREWVRRERAGRDAELKISEFRKRVKACKFPISRGKSLWRGPSITIWGNMIDAKNKIKSWDRKRRPGDVGQKMTRTTLKIGYLRRILGMEGPKDLSGGEGLKMDSRFPDSLEAQGAELRFWTKRACESWCMGRDWFAGQRLAGAWTQTCSLKNLLCVI